MGTRVPYRHTSSSDTSRVITLFVIAALFGLGGYLCQTAVSDPAMNVVVTLYVIGGIFILAGVGALLPFRGNKRTSTN